MPNVIGIFEDSSQAQQAIERMTKDRVAREKITLVSSDSIQERKSGQAAGPSASTRPGELLASLSDLGVPAEEATGYEDQVRAGRVLVAVCAGDSTEADRVANLMEVQGAVDVEGTTERGNVEAAPEYEGTRAADEGDTLKSPKSSAPGRRTAPDETRNRDYRGPGGRIRIFGGAIEPMA